MKHMRKRILSLLMTFAMLLSMVPVNAFAVEAPSPQIAGVAQIGETIYSTLPDAVDAAKAGDTVTLTADVTLDKGAPTDSRYDLHVKKDLTIDGAGHTITNGLERGIGVQAQNVTFKNVTINNAKANGRGIDTRGSIGTFTLDGVTINTTGSGNCQPLTIGGDQATKANIVVKNSTITANADGYAILMFNPVNMTIDNSTLTGWADLYFKGPNYSAGSSGSVVAVNNSVLNSKNDNSGVRNSFAAIQFEACEPRNSDVSITLTDCVANIEATGDQYQEFVGFHSTDYTNTPPENYVNTNNKVVIQGDKTRFTFTGEMAVMAAGYDNSKKSNNSVAISGGSFNVDPAPYMAEGLKAVVNADGSYSVGQPAVELTYTDGGAQKTVYYGSLKTAMKAADKLPSAITDAVVTVVSDVNEPSTYFYAYDANKVVINQGVTVTCSMIKMGSSSALNRVILENHGTLNVAKMPYSSGTGLLDNSGTINCGYIKTETEGWINSGVINLGWNQEDFASELITMNNTGTIKADYAGYQVTFLKPVKVNATDTCNGSYLWNGEKWVADGAFAAVKDGEITAVYGSFDEAMTYAKANQCDTIRILEDVTVNAPMEFDSKMTLDMNGKTITMGSAKTQSLGALGDGYISAVKGADLTITGNGTLTYDKKDAKYRLGILVDTWGDAKVTIENGTFQTSLVCAEVNDTSAVTILGGSFAADNQYDGRVWLLNKKDAAKDTAKFIVKGGSFANYDPANSKTESPDDNFVAPGYETIPSGENYIVRETVTNPVAKIDEIGFASFKDALAFYKAGDTIEVLNGFVSLSEFEGYTANEVNVNMNGNEMLVSKDITLTGVRLNITSKAYTAIRFENQVTTDKMALTLNGGSVINVDCLNTARLGIMSAIVTVNVDGEGTQLNAKNMKGNATNGGTFNVTNGAALTMDGAGSYGLSCNGLNVENATVTIKNTGYSGVYASSDGVKLTNGAKLTVESCGILLPLESKWSHTYAPIQMKNGDVSVDDTSSIVLNNNVDKNGNAINYIHSNNKNTTNNYAMAQITGDFGVSQFLTLQDAVAAAKPGETVKLIRDVVMPYPTTAGEGLRPDISIDKDLTLDLAGHTIKRNECTGSVNGVPAFFDITAGVNVTVTGNGTMDAELGDNSSYGINLNHTDAVLTIENGTFLGAPTAFQVQHGTLNVKGGTFDMSASCKAAAPALAKYIINCIDDYFKDGTAKIVVTGGTFAGFDPSANPEGAGTTYVAPGYESVKEGDNYTVQQIMIAQIGESKYPTLQDAVDAANGKTTITLLRTTEGNGVKVPAGKDIVFDFNGNTYTVNAELVGSTGTVTNGFQLLKGATVVMKNGTLDAGTSAKILVQKYCDLTLEDMTLVGGPQTSYVLSNNNGKTVLKGNTNITAAEGKFAFDAYYWPSNSYGDNYVVTENLTGTIIGKIEHTHDNTVNDEQAKAHSGITLDSGIYSVDPTVFCAKDYMAEKQSDNMFKIVCKFVAQNEETRVFYNTIADAVNAANAGETIRLTRDSEAEPTVMLNKGIKLNLNGYHLEADNFISFNGNHVIDNAKVKGILKAKNLVLDKNNEQLPIWDNAKQGYYFSDVTHQQKFLKDESVNFEVGFKPYLGTLGYNAFQDGAADNNVEFSLKLAWKAGTEHDSQQEFTYVDDQVKRVYSSNHAFVLKVSSVPDNVQDVQIYSVIRSTSTGVEIISPTPLNYSNNVQ